jgi:hypothetical protein
VTLSSWMNLPKRTSLGMLFELMGVLTSKVLKRL